MNATFEVRSRDALGLTIALVVAVIGLVALLMSVAAGEMAADAALLAAGGSMDAARYQLLFQLNAEAVRLVGAVLLGVGTFFALRRV